MALSYQCIFHSSFCLLVRLNRLKLAARVRFASYNFSSCISSPYFFYCITCNFPTLVEIMFSPEAYWVESSSLASFKLKKHVLCGVMSHVSPVFVIIMLGSNINLVMSRNIFICIVVSMNSAWLCPAWLFVAIFLDSAVPFCFVGLLYKFFASSQQWYFLWHLLPQLWYESLKFPEFLLPELFLGVTSFFLRKQSIDLWPFFTKWWPFLWNFHFPFPLLYTASECSFISSSSSSESSPNFIKRYR